MTKRTRPILVLALGGAIVLLVAIGGVALVVNRGESDNKALTPAAMDERHAIGDAAEQYAARAAATDHDGSYGMLSVGTKTKISPEEWQRRNEESLAVLGPLDAVDVGETRQLSDTEGISVIVFRYANAGTLSLRMRLVLENGDWRIAASIAPRTP